MLDSVSPRLYKNDFWRNAKVSAKTLTYMCIANNMLNTTLCAMRVEDEYKALTRHVIFRLIENGNVKQARTMLRWLFQEAKCANKYTHDCRDFPGMHTCLRKHFEKDIDNYLTLKRESGLRYAETFSQACDEFQPVFDSIRKARRLKYSPKHLS